MRKILRNKVRNHFNTNKIRKQWQGLQIARYGWVGYKDIQTNKNKKDLVEMYASNHPEVYENEE